MAKPVSQGRSNSTQRIIVSHIEQNLSEIKQRMQHACQRSKRDPAEITLIAVSKNFPADDVRIAYEAGHTQFGENRWQEAESKIPLLPQSLQWHYIGSLQRNKVRKVLPHFCLIHSIDSLRLATYTNELAKELGLFPRVLLQVNLAGELSKGGFSAEELYQDAAALLQLERLEICGLMTVPPAVEDPEQARKWFRGVRELRDQIESLHSVTLPVLSMGMSGDFEVAIEEGATHIRVGTSIFGRRQY